MRSGQPGNARVDPVGAHRAVGDTCDAGYGGRDARVVWHQDEARVRPSDGGAGQFDRFHDRERRQRTGASDAHSDFEDFSCPLFS